MIPKRDASRRAHPRPCLLTAARLCLTGLLGVWSGSAAAQTDAGDIYIRGFASQGYVNSTGNDFLIDQSTKGSAEFSEVAITAYAFPTDRLTVAAQLLARDFGQVGNNQVILDWGFGDYRFKDEFGIRAGKVRVPNGFYNEVRDVDIARDVLFLPQGVYDERFRDFLNAYEGIGAYGTLPISGGGIVDYQAWAGTFNVPDVTRGFWRNLWDSVGAGLAPGFEADLQPESGTLVVDFAGVDEASVSFPWAYGAALAWETPLEGLRVGASAFRTEVEAEADLIYDVQAIPDDPTVFPEFVRIETRVANDIDVKVLATGSVEWVSDRLTLVGEYNLLDLTTSLELVEDPTVIDDRDLGKSDAWYGLASFQVDDAIAISAQYGEYYDNRSNRDGAGSRFPFAAFQKDAGIGVRWDLTPNWRVKYEHHYVNGVAQVEGVSTAFVPEGTERYWSYFALKSTFHF